MKKEYLIIGDNNHWYASGITSLKIAREELKDIKENQIVFNDEPEKFYIFKAEEIEQVDLDDIKV